MVAAGLRHAFQQPNQDGARVALHHLAEQLHNRWPKLKSFIDATSEDVLAYLTFPVQHRAKLHSTNPLERLNKEIKRRADVVGIFPNTDSIAPPTMLPISPGAHLWIGMICGRSMGRGSALAC